MGGGKKTGCLRSIQALVRKHPGKILTACALKREARWNEKGEGEKR